MKNILNVFLIILSLNTFASLKEKLVINPETHQIFHVDINTENSSYRVSTVDRGFEQIVLDSTLSCAQINNNKFKIVKRVMETVSILKAQIQNQSKIEFDIQDIILVENNLGMDLLMVSDVASRCLSLNQETTIETRTEAMKDLINNDHAVLCRELDLRTHDIFLDLQQHFGIAYYAPKETALKTINEIEGYLNIYLNKLKFCY